MRFQFRLRPIDEIVPWGLEDEHRHLSWFGLTDGWFWIEVSDQELFRYSEAALAYWSQLRPHAFQDLLPYTDYQIARYWEDLIEMLPVILDPIPADFAASIATITDAHAWMDSCRRQLSEPPNDAEIDRYDTATLWWSQRNWDADHLVHPPQISLWRTDDTVTIRWDNRGVLLDHVRVWDTQYGELATPVTEFVDAVCMFNTQFLEAMEVRIRDLAANPPPPPITVDFAALEREQAYRSALLKNAVRPWTQEARRAFSWDQVREAMAPVE